MGAVQSTYLSKQPEALLGMEADMMPAEKVSRLIEGGDVPFGRAVVQGTADNQVKLGAAGVFIGITVKDVGLDPAQGDKYVVGDTANIMTKGTMFVTAAEAVVAGDPVYRTATGTLNKTSSGNTLIVGALWETSVGSGALGRIRLK